MIYFISQKEHSLCRRICGDCTQGKSFHMFNEQFSEQLCDVSGHCVDAVCNVAEFPPPRWLCTTVGLQLSFKPNLFHLMKFRWQLKLFRCQSFLLLFLCFSIFKFQCMQKANFNGWVKKDGCLPRQGMPFIWTSNMCALHWLLYIFAYTTSLLIPLLFINGFNPAFKIRSPKQLIKFLQSMAM